MNRKSKSQKGAAGSLVDIIRQQYSAKNTHIPFSCHKTARITVHLESAGTGPGSAFSSTASHAGGRQSEIAYWLTPSSFSSSFFVSIELMDTRLPCSDNCVDSMQQQQHAYEDDNPLPNFLFYPIMLTCLLILPKRVLFFTAYGAVCAKCSGKSNWYLSCCDCGRYSSLFCANMLSDSACMTAEGVGDTRWLGWVGEFSWAVSILQITTVASYSRRRGHTRAYMRL
jgi:hypothetical protein